MAALSRLQARIKENFQETTRDITLLTTGSTSTSAGYFDSSDERIKEISKLLESRMDKERLEGMKRIIALMSRGRDMEGFFAQVVKNVAASNIEIKKLVYIYLLRFASTNSDLLLLSINTFQKDLSDPSPLIRSMSLRVLTSIRVPVIQGIVMLGLKKLVQDRNPWVRKTVAGGLAKVYGMDPSSLPQLLSILQTLLASPSPLTLGASLTAFSEICPDQLDLLHPYYRHICRLLVDADEWGQVVALDILTRYARTMLEKPDHAGAVNPATVPEKQGAQPKSKKMTEESEDEFAGIDDDLAMLLHYSKALFQSRNPAVVLGTAVMYFHLAPAGHSSIGQGLIVAPLIKLANVAGLDQRTEIATLTWEVIEAMIAERPWLFAPRFTAFFLHVSDPSHVKMAKLRAMVTLVSSDNVKSALREFRHYTHFSETAVAEEAIRAIGHCVRSQPTIASSGLGTLMRMLSSKKDALVAQAVIVLKSVILALPSTPSTGLPDPQRLVARLAKGLDSISHPRARASVFWLVGQFAGGESIAGGLGWDGLAPWAPDVLRKGVKGFKDESTIAKLQILTLTAKMLVLSPATPQLNSISLYLASLARYDADYDVRDRSRFLHALLRGVRDENRSVNEEDTEGAVETEEDMGGVILRREQVRVVLLGKREDADVVVAKTPGDDFDVGSMSRISHKQMVGYRRLPDWTDDPTDSSLRESEIDTRPPPPTSVNSQTLVSHTSSPSLSQAQPPPPPAPVHMSQSAASLPRTNVSSGSPSGSVPQNPSESLASMSMQASRAKFKDLDKFLDSESESSGEEESDESDRPLPVRTAPVAQYDEETESSEEEETESEDEHGQDERLLRGDW